MVLGTILKTVTLPTTNGRGLTFDGQYFWYIDTITGLVYQVARDGTQLRSFDPGLTDQWGIEAVGGDLYLTDLTGTTYVRLFTKSGVLKKSWPNILDNSETYDLRLDHDGFWTINYDNNKFYKLSRNFEVLYSKATPQDWPMALGYDGQYLWLGTEKDYLIRMMTRSGVVLKTFTLTFYATSIVFDGQYLWILEDGSSNLHIVSRV